MDPVTIANLVLLLVKGGMDVYGQFKTITKTTVPGGPETVDVTISVRLDKLAGYLAVEQSDLAETQAEIARRTAAGG